VFIDEFEIKYVSAMRQLNRLKLGCSKNPTDFHSSGQVKSEITNNNAFCSVQRATAHIKIEVVRCYGVTGVTGSLSVFQAGCLDCDTFPLFFARFVPSSGISPIFDCAVAFCTMQNALLAIRNLTFDFYSLKRRAEHDQVSPFKTPKLSTDAALDPCWNKLVLRFLRPRAEWHGELEPIKIKIKILGSECQTSGTYAKTAKQATTK
jgi:hypothetical protein